MKSHKVESGSLLRFFKKHSKKHVKAAIELQPIKSKAPSVNASPAPPTGEVNPKPPQKAPLPPKRPWGSKSKCGINSTDLKAPANITRSDLNKRSPEFRDAHVRYYNQLKDRVAGLDKTMYYNANSSALGVQVRQFRRWFELYEDDLKAIKAKQKPKLKNDRRQNKVLCKAERHRFTAEQKLDLRTRGPNSSQIPSRK
ncbi:MAG: hypothetical protein GY774_38770 [Planctomycetes bacterium]|nr:hypothetical protein [Planctomycetota bacterium]